MSHITTYGKKIKNINLLCEISKNKFHTVIRGKQKITLYGTQEINAIASIKIPSWKYSIGILKNGDLLYDNWGSDRSSMDDLGELLQDYNENLIHKNLDFVTMGNYTTETMENGDKKLTLIMED